MKKITTLKLWVDKRTNQYRLPTFYTTFLQLKVD